MNTARRRLLLTLLLVTLPVAYTAAHVPYIEGRDYSAEEPFLVTNIYQSKAFYAYLDAGDVDEFVMEVSEPERIYINMLIPFCKEYALYATTYALTGPRLPAAEQEMPIALPAGHGAIVFAPGYTDWSERPFMYEFFSDRQYFEGTRYTYNAETPGEYRLVVWHAERRPGDYIAIIGRAEKFGVDDMKLAAVNTPIIRRQDEMHSQCTSEGDFSEWFTASN